jgi:hypothetical protein
MIHSEEPVIKGYDPRIVGRILRYVKPYWVLVTFSMLFIPDINRGAIAASGGDPEGGGRKSPSRMARRRS